MRANLPPQEQVALNFMKRKGYGHVEPMEIEELDGTPCWYFLYVLTEGTLELEVSWDSRRQQWDTNVTTFALHSDSHLS